MGALLRLLESYLMANEPKLSSIVGRLRLVFLCVSFVLIASAVIGFSQIRKLSQTTSDLIEDSIPVFLQNIEIEQNLVALSLAMQSAEAASSQNELEAIDRSVRQKLTFLANNVSGMAQSADLSDRYLDLSAALDELTQNIDDALRVKHSSVQKQRDIEVMNERLDESMSNVRASLSELAVDTVTDLDRRVTSDSLSFEQANEDLLQLQLKSQAVTQMSLQVETLEKILSLMTPSNSLTEHQKFRVDLRRAVQSIAIISSRLPPDDNLKDIARELIDINEVIFSSSGLSQQILALRSISSEHDQLRQQRANQILQVSNAASGSVNNARNQVDFAKNNLNEVSNRVIATLLVAALITLLFFGFANYFIVEKQINRRMSRLTGSMSLVTPSQIIEHEIDVHGDDEIGKMADALRAFKATAHELNLTQKEMETRFSLFADAMVLSGVYISQFNANGDCVYSSFNDRMLKSLDLMVRNFLPTAEAFEEAAILAGANTKIVHSTQNDLGLVYSVESKTDLGKHTYMFHALRFATRGFALICLDLTRQKELEAKLSQSERMSTIATLVSGAAHEFNNMLAIIQGGLELIQITDNNPNAVSRHIDTSLKACEGARMAVHELLSFSRKREAVDKDEIMARDLQSQLQAMLERQIKRSDIIEWRVGDLVGMLEINVADVQRAFINLVNNALDAIPKYGKVTIRVAECFEAATSLDEIGPHLIVEVADTGPGIPPEIRQKIFEPFFTTKQIGMGTGLGLWSGFNAIKLEGGELTYRDNKPHGAVFVIRLPLQSRYQKKPEETIEASQEIPISLGRAFLLEDEPNLCAIQKEMLEKLGFGVAAALSLTEARKIWAREDNFTLALFDRNLPDGDGAVFAVSIKAAHPHCSVYVVTGDPTDMSSFGSLDGVFVKPFGISSLRDLVHSDGLKFQNKAANLSVGPGPAAK